MTKKISALIIFLASLPAGAQSPAELGTALELFRQHQDVLRQALVHEPGMPTPEPRRAASKADAIGAPLLAGAGRDPFALTPLMHQGGATAFSAGDAGHLPGMKLKGLALRPGEPALALIEVEGGSAYLLRERETFTVRAEQNTFTLKVKQIHPASVDLETGASQTVVLR